MQNRVSRRQALQCTGWLGATLVAGAAPFKAQASSAQSVLPAAVQSLLPPVSKRGMARMRFVGLSIYDASLWVPAGFEPQRYAAYSFALDLAYWRSLRGRLIAERSLKEMQRAGALDAAVAKRWLHFMGQTFPDVHEGDHLTGVHVPEQGAHFFFNGKALAASDDAVFAECFFGIWLAPWTSEPQLRSQLLAEL
ncbi:chalcone isomerase family protein [Curvibacter sp. CHRR-16]|uniref:chalcone isomerase family protein n=1 Tax=Curvibacter sp. CHRR-16 TaxID=2835872 RepID=UPI001BDAF4FE|nr:chalcone isomerase family protein [Curvibacter sp. CHRR-16]MBT0571092.1 chalcone isomerase family protein [Curvibacter sp. CHRR-16]